MHTHMRHHRDLYRLPCCCKLALGGLSTWDSNGCNVGCICVVGCCQRCVAAACYVGLPWRSWSTSTHGVVSVGRCHQQLPWLPWLCKSTTTRCCGSVGRRALRAHYTFPNVALRVACSRSTRVWAGVWPPPCPVGLDHLCWAYKVFVGWHKWLGHAGLTRLRGWNGSSSKP